MKLLRQVSLLVRFTLFWSEMVHSFVYILNPLIPIQGCWGGGVGAYPSCYWARGRVHPGQVVSPSQGQMETNGQR